MGRQMQLVSDNDKPVKTNVVCLHEVAPRYGLDGECQHENVQVDAILNHVVCSKCKVELNPVAVLVRMARSESRFGERIKTMTEMQAKLDARKRCKCDHCHKITTIHI